MAARPWLLLLGLAAAVLQVGGQRAPDTTGFISIDCGLSEQSSYVGDVTNLLLSSDAGFTDAGTNYDVSARYANPLYRRFLTVRSFPGAVDSRSCYTLPSAVPGTTKYMVRAAFKYGDYDGRNKLPIFDLYLGVNLWRTVNITDAGLVDVAEVIAVIPEERVQVCMVNIGSGTPFISTLDLRPLKNSLYPQANATQALSIIFRSNFGASDVIRYPDDPYDRLWVPWWSVVLWSGVFGHGNFQDGEFQVPDVVMKTAITPFDASDNILLVLDAVDSTVRHYFTLYFAELHILNSSQTRRFNVGYNNYLSTYNYEPTYLKLGYKNIEPVHFFNQYNVTIARAPNSTLPPIINACEFFSAMSTANVGTHAHDASTMIAIKAKYQVKKNWEGDPCSPKTLVWHGLNCSYPDSVPPRITSVNMSFGGLGGDISSYFAKLKAIQYLDLSHNELTGSIPNELSQLPSLVVLDLSNNQLSGPIPSELMRRLQNGSLTLRYGNNPGLCSNRSSCLPTINKKRNSMVVVYILVSVVIVVALGSLSVLLLSIMREKQATSQDEVINLTQDSNGRRRLQLDKCRFTYGQLEVITNNFQQVVGQGGIGSVYDGFLDDGTRVAVKLLSQYSNEGVKEFLTEARILAKIHHKNLVSLIGYCKDKEYLALVYEHMSGRNLEDRLRGRDGSDGCLTWRQRLRIAIESAQGLEYLHKACNTPFIHRDMETSNILVDENLKAKVAGFGLLKAFNHDDNTHICTDRKGSTHGQLAPEYDVYSFGILLLEVITGQPPVLQFSEPTSIIQWMQQRLARGDIEGVVDTRMREEHDINSVWKAADLALKCSLQSPEQRPTMIDVVAQLQECLKLEENHMTSGTGGYFHTSRGGNDSSVDCLYATDGQSVDVAQGNATFEMEHNFGNDLTMASGPAAR